MRECHADHCSTTHEAALQTNRLSKSGPLGLRYLALAIALRHTRMKAAYGSYSYQTRPHPPAVRRPYEPDAARKNARLCGYSKVVRLVVDAKNRTRGGRSSTLQEPWAWQRGRLVQPPLVLKKARNLRFALGLRAASRPRFVADMRTAGRSTWCNALSISRLKGGSSRWRRIMWQVKSRSYARANCLRYGAHTIWGGGDQFLSALPARPQSPQTAYRL